MKGFDMETVSIGFYREDGDFAVLATLNNNDNWIHNFDSVVSHTRDVLTNYAGFECIVLRRQDAPDYVTID
jgi:hypothetical protein